ncbi:MAG: hypothetical protein QXU32_01525 [Nitrososphaerales archaeon]
MEIYAWKILRFENGALVSPTYRVAWPHGQYLVADNMPELKIGENPRGGPGIHAVTEEGLNELKSYVVYDDAVLVKIKCAGRVYKLDNGIVLAEKAKPVEIYGLPHAFRRVTPEKLELEYNAKVHVLDNKLQRFYFANNTRVEMVDSNKLSENDPISVLYDNSRIHIISNEDPSRRLIVSKDLKLDPYNLSDDLLTTLGTFLFLYRGAAIDLVEDKKIWCPYFLEKDVTYPIGAGAYEVEGPIGILNPYGSHIIALLDSNLKFICDLLFSLRDNRVSEFNDDYAAFSQEDLSIIRDYFMMRNAWHDDDLEVAEYSAEMVDADYVITIYDLDDFMKIDMTELRLLLVEEDEIGSQEIRDVDEYGISYVKEIISYYQYPAELEFSYGDFLSVVKEALEDVSTGAMTEQQFSTFLTKKSEILRFMHNYINEINMDANERKNWLVGLREMSDNPSASRLYGVLAKYDRTDLMPEFLADIQ